MNRRDVLVGRAMTRAMHGTKADARDREAAQRCDRMFDGGEFSDSAWCDIMEQRQHDMAAAVGRAFGIPAQTVVLLWYDYAAETGARADLASGRAKWRYSSEDGWHLSYVQPNRVEDPS